MLVLELRISSDLSLFSDSTCVDLSNTLLGIGSDNLKFSSLKRDLLGEILIDGIPLLISSLPEQLELLFIVDDSHIEVILLPLHIVEGSELGLHIEWLFDLFRKQNLSHDDIHEFKTFGAKHLIKEVLHLLGVGLAFNLVHFEMGLSSDEHSHSLGQGSLQLLV